MLYTVTFNPSLDYYVKVNNIKGGIVNRTAAERLTVGGKGINVALQLKELGNQTVSLGFVAGFTGKEICEEITKLGLDHDFIEVNGRSRINVKVKSNMETDINGAGAQISASDITKLTDKLKKLLKSGDWLIISGSVPSTLGDNAYADMIGNLKNIEGVNVVVDACGKLLTNTLKHNPFLI
jgi:1-phosphofructokinase